MMRRALVGVFMAALGATAIAGDVRVATFNVQNYLCMDRRIEGRFLPGHPKPEREKAAVREVLRAVRADVVCLQEIGARPFLEELQQDLAREGLDYTHAAWLDAADPMRHVAILSRLPFREVVTHTDVVFKYLEREERVKRGMLEVRVDSPAGVWRLFVVHLKSPLTEEAADPGAEKRRTAEARALRDVILKRTADPGTMFLVAGDFNASTDSRVMAAFATRGDSPISTVVHAVDSRGETWTHRQVSSDRYERFDYLLASPGLLPRVRGGRAVIHDGAAVLEGSDHRLVWVDLAMEDPAVVPLPETETPAGEKPAGAANYKN
jgi:endonuclease/exonuclease/phosphatase family metal-dependent hydrolase